jgi:hypothetical protein
VPPPKKERKSAMHVGGDRAGPRVGGPAGHPPSQRQAPQC